MSEDIENDVVGSGLTTVGVDPDDAATGEAAGEGPGARDQSQVLLLGPIWRDVDDEVCTGQIESSAGDDVDVLVVTLTQSADERIAVLRRHMEQVPARIGVVSASDDRPSETSVAGSGAGTAVTVDVVEDPSDLPRLGMAIQAAAAEFDGDRPTLVCFHSLTALLQYADVQRVFRFLHILQNAVDARSHFHMDANSHDDRTVETIKQLFDAVIEFDAEGNRLVTK